MQPVRAALHPVPHRVPFFTVRILHAIAHFADTHGWLFFAAISLACGWGLLQAMVTRRLDHDEIFTFYIAQAPSLHRLLQVSHAVDFQPPLSYLLVRASFAMFGTSAWSCRLPFPARLFVHRRAHVLFCGAPFFSALRSNFCLIAMGKSLLFLSAYEARPYALLLCFTTLMLVKLVSGSGRTGPDRTRLGARDGHGDRIRTIALARFRRANLCCVFRRGTSPFLDSPKTRLALMVSAPGPDYLHPHLLAHASQSFHHAVCQEYRVTPLVLLSFYWESIRFVITPLAVIAAFALLWPIFHRPIVHIKPTETAAANSHAMRVPFGFLLVSFSFIPLAIGTLLARTGTAFFSRYGVVWLVPFAMVPALVLGYRTQHDRLVGTGAALLLAVLFFFNTTGKSWLLDQVSNLVSPRVAARLLYVLSLPPINTVHYPPIPPYLQAGIAAAPRVSHLDSVAPGLPLVANTGLTFVEADHEESAQVAQRLYLLTDDEAASTIAHDTVVAHSEGLKEAFPLIRGKVEPYCAFISSHPRFVVIGAYNHPQGWLLRKLDRDGAQLRVIGTWQWIYRRMSDL